MNPLERRYRRLLLAYPADHRREHGEEMLGVLLDAAATGRTRPGLAETADVLRSGLTLRARHANGAGWDDALALVSLLATALLCALVPWGLLMVAFGSTVFAVPALAWPVVLFVGLLAPHRAAAVASSVALLGLAVARPLHGTAPTGPWILLAVVATLATICSPGPRRGLELLGRARAASLVAGVGALGTYAVFASGYGMILLPRVPGPLSGPAQARLLLVVGILLVGFAVVRVSSPAARRATLLLAGPMGMIAVMMLQVTTRFDRRFGVLYGHEVVASVGGAVTAMLLAGIAASFGWRLHRDRA